MYGFKKSPAGTTHYLLHNEGVENRIIFSSQEDYDRFDAYLYLLNAVEAPRVSNIFARKDHGDLYSIARGERLVAVGAYCILAHEFQILATPLVEGGISRFMQKIQTAYTMYFNSKYQRGGRLFRATYRAQQTESESLLRRWFCEVHLRPAELFDARWQEAIGIELYKLVARALQYRYSSAGEYVDRTYRIVDVGPYPRFFTRARDVKYYIGEWNKLQRENARQ